jgi:SAM-dependent methyltransferase
VSSAPCCGIDGTFDSRIARRDLERYRRRGPSPSTQQLLNAIRDASFPGATVLDVGGGIGTIAHELLGTGAERATVVDASTAYLSVAREEADRRQVSARLQLIQGDFVTLMGGVPQADIVTLDKVVCCYPSMEQLIAASTERAARFYGIVYPRDRWWVRLWTAAKNAIRRLRGSAFRVYIFPNARIASAIKHAGFVLRRQTRGFVWVVELYERNNNR